jgi:methylated-DNA-[protein]-cysteine S-methyltransferase
MNRLTVSSPIGPLTVTEDDGAIVALDFAEARAHDDTPLLRRAKRELEQYFARSRQVFDMPLAPTGTKFQRAVWDVMLAIPYGETRSYGDVAKKLRSGPRAVGGACGKNAIPIIIPCHRIIGAHGALGGYSGGSGFAIKRALLDLENGRNLNPLSGR